MKFLVVVLFKRTSEPTNFSFSRSFLIEIDDINNMYESEFHETQGMSIFDSKLYAKTEGVIEQQKEAFQESFKVGSISTVLLPG